MLVLELRAKGKWNRVGELREGEPPGSISHNDKTGRQVFMFTCHGDHSIIQRVREGIDMEVGRVRAIKRTDGFEEISRLTPARPCLEFLLKTDRMALPLTARFRHE